MCVGAALDVNTIPAEDEEIVGRVHEGVGWRHGDKRALQLEWSQYIDSIKNLYENFL